MNTPSKAISPRFLSFQLALLIAMTPFAIDTYLPAFPQMADDFSVTVQKMGLTVSTYLLGFALGQIIGGPLSDRHGRKPIGYIGLLFFILSSLLIIVSRSFEQLMLFRFLQALGGGLSSVIVAAIVRDNFQGKESAKVFATMGMIVMVAPMVAPAVGSLLIQLADWHIIFWFLMLYALFLLGVILFFIPSSKQEKKPITMGLTAYYITVYGHVLKRKEALPNLLSQAFISGVLFTFITNAAYIFIDHFGVSATAFPWFFSGIIATNIILSRLNIRLLRNHSSLSILRWGGALQLLACTLLTIHTSFFDDNLYVVWGLMIATVGSVGLIYGNNLSAWMEHFPDISGSANAVFGCTAFAGGAIVGSFTSGFQTENIAPIMLTMFFCSLVSNIVLMFSKQQTP